MLGFLIMQRGPEIGRRYDMAGDQFTIGRRDDNDLTLNDELVSRYHAVLRRENRDLVIIDVGSANGVMVNDTALEPGVPHRLQHGDVFVIGRSVFSFQNPVVTGAPPAPTRRSSEPRTLEAGAGGWGSAGLAPAQARVPPEGFSGSRSPS